MQNSEIVHLRPSFVVFMDYNKLWITFDILRFNLSYLSFVLFIFTICFLSTGRILLNCFNTKFV